MNTIDLETACNEIQQACESSHGGGRLPYFFLIGAGVSNPPIKLAPEIQDECKTVAQKYKRTGQPSTNSALDTYSFWFDKAYPQPIQRQKYLRALIGGKPISQANFRLAHLLLEARIANLVVTTNFDDFLSRALILFGKQPIVCDHPETVERIDPEEREDIQIVHVHGSYWFYDCCNLRSEVKERAGPDSRSTQGMAALLENVLWRRVPLVIGYGGWEEDVMMTALQRRLRNGLPNRLYWFCYRQDSTDSLPDWLKTNANVYFVVPQKPVEPVAEPPEPDLTLPATTSAVDIKSKTKKGGDEAVLSAQDVLDKLIQTFDLESPPLTNDPLGFFANFLRTSLPQEDPVRPAKDLYALKSVVTRIEEARDREEAERRAARVIESKMEEIRDALRRAQYREAINLAQKLDFDDIGVSHLSELIDAIWSAATLLADNSVNEIRGYDLVFAIYERLLDLTESSEETDRLHSPRAARALLNKGITLGVMQKHDKEVLAYAKLAEKFGDSEDPQVKAVIADGLINKGLAYGELKRDQDELAAYDQVIELYAESKDPIFQDHLMKAMFNKSIVFAALKRFEDAIALCDEIALRFAESEELTLREAAAQALLNKGVYFGRLKRYDDAVRVYEDVVERFGQASEMAVRKSAADALYNRIQAFAKGEKIEAAIAAADDLVKQFGQASEAILREVAIQGLLAKAFYLRKQNDNARSLETAEEVIKRCTESPEHPLRQSLPKAIASKAIALGNLGKQEESNAAFREVIKNFATYQELPIRHTVGQAFNGLGFATLLEAKLARKQNDSAASERLRETQELLNSALEYKPDDPIILGNQSYAAFLQGDKEKSRDLLTRALELGGEAIREIELEDTQIHPLPEDDEFRALINSIPRSASRDQTNVSED